MKASPIRSHRYFVVVLMLACLMVLPMLPGCGDDSKNESEELSPGSANTDTPTPQPPAPNEPAHESEPLPEPQPDPEPQPEPIRLTRSDLDDPARLAELADQCFPAIPHQPGTLGPEMVTLAIAYRAMDEPQRFEQYLERAKDRMGDRSYELRRAAEMLGRAQYHDTLEQMRSEATDESRQRLFAHAMFKTLDSMLVPAYGPLLGWCWEDAQPRGKSACWWVAQQQIRLGQIDNALNRLESSPASEYLRDEKIVEAIALLANQPDRAVPFTESLHKANGRQDWARVFLVQSYTQADEPAKAAQQLELIEGLPYRAMARLVRHRVERSAGRETTEPGESLVVELLPDIHSPPDAPRNHLWSARSKLENMLLEELLIYGREDLARPIIAGSGVFDAGRVNSTSVEFAMGLYLRNNHPETTWQLFERLDDGSTRNNYLEMFDTFASDPVLTEQDLINLRPYLDDMYTTSATMRSLMVGRLHTMSFVIDRAGLSDSETWASFVESIENPAYIMAVCIGTLESQLNLPGPRLQPLVWADYPLPRR